jgi:hypothetical protein
VRIRFANRLYGPQLKSLKPFRETPCVRRAGAIWLDVAWLVFSPLKAEPLAAVARRDKGKSVRLRPRPRDWSVL